MPIATVLNKKNLVRPAKAVRGHKNHVICSFAATVVLSLKVSVVVEYSRHMYWKLERIYLHVVGITAVFFCWISRSLI